MTKTTEFEPWYKYGVAFLYLEMAVAIQITLIALYMTLTGTIVDRVMLIGGIGIVTSLLAVFIYFISKMREKK